MTKYYKLIECSSEETKGNAHVIVDDDPKHPLFGRTDLNYAVLKNGPSAFLFNLRSILELTNEHKPAIKTL